MNAGNFRFLFVGLGSAAFFFVGLLSGSGLLQLATKAIPVLAVAAWLRPWQNRDMRLVAVGLLLSAIGDLCLQISSTLFIAGLSAFLSAHLAYLVAFLGRTRMPAALFALPVIMFGLSTFLWLKPLLGTMSMPVFAYVVVICSMLWRAWAQVGDQRVPRTAAWSAALGASSFAVSDTLVAYNRFVEPVLALQVLLMLLYWAGQWGIARSARTLTT